MFTRVCFGALVNLVHLVPHATDIGHSRKFAAFALCVMMLSSLGGRFVFGYIADKMDAVKLMTVLLVWMFGAMFVFMNIIGIKQVSMFYAYVIIFGFPYGAVAQLTATIINKLFGPASFGAIFGAVFFAGTFGTGFGPLFAGWIYDVTKNYDIAYMVASGLILLSAIILFAFARKPPQRRHA
jgi:MFS family permease